VTNKATVAAQNRNRSNPASSLSVAFAVTGYFFVDSD